MLGNRYLFTISVVVLGIALGLGIAFLMKPQAPIGSANIGMAHTAEQQAKVTMGGPPRQPPGQVATSTARTAPAADLPAERQDGTASPDTRFYQEEARQPGIFPEYQSVGDAGTDRKTDVESGRPEPMAGRADPAEEMTEPTATSEADAAGAEDPLPGEAESPGDDQPTNRGQGRLSLGGRVFTIQGRAVQGIGIFARLYNRSAKQLDAGELSTVSREEGVYFFEGLEEGEYQLRTEATERFPEVKMMVRAGLKSADLVLNEIFTVNLAGRVTDKEGQGLTEVKISVSNQSQGAGTGKDGSYEIPLKVQSDRHYTFRFNRGGFHENRITKKGAELAAAAGNRMDVQLERIGSTTNVDGVVRSEYGESLAGQRVYLQSSSLNARYRAASDKEGNFTLQGVALGTDYRLWVSPGGGMYGRYQRSPVEITTDMLPLEISLPVLDGGSVSGQVVDAEGTPMGNFTLYLRSQKSAGSTRAVTDENGYFGPVKLAAGKVTFFTQTRPQFNISGFDLQAGNQQNAYLVMDWGSYVVRGTVANGSGTAIAGAKVNMSMSYQFDEMKASSNRNTITDESGFFRFTQVGPGVHRIRVNEDRYKPYNTDYDTGGGGDELSIELEPKE